MSDLIGKRLGQYEITGTIGKGGMAVVYQARQPSMDRNVAIKVISSELTESAEFISRFEHEARLIAHLQHAHILPVFDFGREDSTIYLVMRLVEGGSLDTMLRSGGLPLQQTARLLEQIASALTYAHSEGVVHRDLKPNNILMDKSGSPYLTDFGIAKLIESNSMLTATGTVMGTPSYMAPEQWKSETVDARTDIYALGCMLYEMLTGQLPFYGETPFALMYKHFDEMPPTPGKVITGLPEAVNGVIAKAMAKRPEDRFASAVEMSQAFNAAISGAPTPAFVASPTRPVSDVEHTVVGEVAPAETGTVHLPSQPPATAAPQAATSQNAGTVGEARANQRKRLPLIIAAIALLIVLIGAGVVLLAPKPAYASLRTLQGHTEWVEAIAWSPDGSKLASAGDDKTIRIWNPTTGEEIRILHGHSETIYSVVWSADGSKLATGSDDGTIRVWSADKGEALATLTSSSELAKPQLVDWSPDSTKIVSGQTDGTVAIWDVASQKLLNTLPTQGAFWTPVAWSPNGKIIASAGKDNGIQLWDAVSGEPLGNFAAHSEFVASLTWSRDSSRLASTSHDGTIKTWEINGGKAVPVLTINASPSSGVSYAAWSPDGHRLVSSAGFINLGGTDDKTVKIWDAQTGALIATLKDHENPSKMVQWSPDGSKLASAGLDNTVRLWSGN